MTVRILEGDALAMLRTMESESVQAVCTSPPYYSLRAYNTAPKVWGGDSEHAHEWGEHSQRLNNRHAMAVREGLDGKNGVGNYANPSDWNIRSGICHCGAWRGELGLEPNPAMFIEHLVAVFEEVRRVLRKDGVVFCNLGDSYSGSGKGPTGHNGIGDQETRQGFKNGRGRTSLLAQISEGNPARMDEQQRTPGIPGIPPKNLLLIPERFAIAMQDAGWIVRSRIAWCKTSAMPESVRDRPSSAWEHIFMFTRSRSYYWDAEAVRQPQTGGTHARGTKAPVAPKIAAAGSGIKNNGSFLAAMTESAPADGMANLRNFWLLGPEPSREEHYAAFPSEIPRRCIKAATSEKGGCPACGAPWVRVVERQANPAGILGVGNGRHIHDFNPSAKGAHVDAVSRHIGWAPSCSCDAGDPVPQTVLDPFAGSFTTSLVAERLGRNSVGIELSPKYVEMGRKRLYNDCPMFVDIVAPEAGAAVGEPA